MSWMDFDPIMAVERWRRPRCGHDGLCLLRRGHIGFHKDNHAIWFNHADSDDYWADLGDHILNDGPIPSLSKVEMEYAIAFSQRRSNQAVPSFEKAGLNT